MSEFRYFPPAEVNDFQGHPEETRFLQAWSDTVESRFKIEINDLRRELGQEPLFFSEADQLISASVATTAIPWAGFPRIHEVRANGERNKMFAAAEVRGSRKVGFRDRGENQSVDQAFRNQDEYLEWVAIKRDGATIGFAFTAESPEYWEFLAAAAPSLVTDLYSQFTGRRVDWSEISWPFDVWTKDHTAMIFEKGSYNPFNVVNVEECAAHLTHPANTLGAEINLAARATLQRSDRVGNIVSERRRLACCSDFGDANRNSDPTIGAAVNQSVRGGVSVTLANPVGLYIQTFDSARISDQDGNALNGWWRVKRGKDGRVLRAEFRPPEGSRLGISDVRIGNNEPLVSGGQLAELVTMVIYARTFNLNVMEPAAAPCVNRCCVEKSSPRSLSELSVTGADSPCRSGWINAFPEFGPERLSPALSPLAQRTSRRSVPPSSGSGE